MEESDSVGIQRGSEAFGEAGFYDDPLFGIGDVRYLSASMEICHEVVGLLGNLR